MTTHCHAEDCAAEVHGRHVFCRTHWAELPGAVRSSLSFTARFRRSAVSEEAFDRAEASRQGGKMR